MSAPCDGAHASQAHAQYHQLAGAETWAVTWAAQDSQTPILSFSFCHLFFSFSFFPCTEVPEVLMGSAKALSQLGLEPLGPLPTTLRTLGQVTVLISH